MSRILRALTLTLTLALSFTFVEVVVDQGQIGDVISVIR